MTRARTTSAAETSYAGSEAHTHGAAGSRRAGTWLIVAIVLAALNLRPAIVAVGPLTASIQATTGLTSTATSLLTTLPLICLGLFAAVAPSLAGRTGLDRAVLAALVLVVAGVALRLLSPLTALFAGSMIAASGIALGNVLVPAVIKQHYPNRVGALMSLYSVALQTGATVASGFAAPLTSALGLGWRPTLALWAVPAAVAALAWLRRAARTRPATGPQEPRFAVWRSSLGWGCAVFIGLQSGVYFALAAWLPSLLHDHGLSSDTAGYMLSVVGLAGIAGGLPMPILAARMRRQRSLVGATVAFFTAGLLGLLADPAHLALLWSILLGLGQGCGLSLALTLFTLRSRTPAGAAQLSGMAQTIGYLIAALGPFVAGYIHSLTSGWTVPIVVLLVALVPLTVAGLLITRPRTLEDELTRDQQQSDRLDAARAGTGAKSTTASQPPTGG